MSKRLERTIVTHAAPTLAGHKCANLLFWRGRVDDALLGYLEDLNRQLMPKGVQVRLLHEAEDHALVFVCRPARLERLLQQSEIRAFLAQRGYPELTAEGCLQHLSHRLRSGEGFPHEVGVFLDYPLPDVIRYIQDPGCHTCLVGCWKAYTDEEQAMRRFSLHRKCREVYADCWRRGFGVARLTVAA